MENEPHQTARQRNSQSASAPSVQAEDVPHRPAPLFQLTLDRMRSFFHEANATVFDGELREPVFRISASGRKYGFCGAEYNGPLVIILSRTLNLDEMTFRETLLHEMVHLHIWQRYGWGAPEALDHGPLFKSYAPRIMAAYGVDPEAPFRDPTLEQILPHLRKAPCPNYLVADLWKEYGCGGYTRDIELARRIFEEEFSSSQRYSNDKHQLFLVETRFQLKGFIPVLRNNKIYTPDIGQVALTRWLVETGKCLRQDTTDPTSPMHPPNEGLVQLAIKALEREPSRPGRIRTACAAALLRFRQWLGGSLQ